MKNILFLFILLFLKTSIVSAQSPILSLDAEKGFNNLVWQDQSGNNNHIALSKPTAKNADGVYFDGNNSAILSKALPLSNFTIYMTVKFEIMGGTLLGNGQPSSYGLHYPNNVVYSAIDKPAADFGTTALTTNKLMVVTLTRDVNKNSGNVTLFVNGELIGVFQGSQKNTFNLTNLVGEMGYLFKGWMKSVAVYNVVHDEARVKNISLAANSTTKIITTPNINLNTANNSSFISMPLRLPFSNQIRTYRVKKHGDDYILNGDIIVSKRSLNPIDITPANASGIVGRTENFFESFKWKNGEIPVVIDANIVGKGLQDVVYDALEELNNKTELCYRPKNDRDNDYVRIIFDSGLGFQGGRSYVGRDGGEQKLKLNLPAGQGKFVIVHELLHAAGFYHEQSREDRNNYVRILEDNIQDDHKINFETEEESNFQYDYCSIMHYSATQFSKNSKPTIECLSNGRTVPCPPCMGAQNGLSDLDIRGIDAFYSEISRFPCGTKWRTASGCGLFKVYGEIGTRYNQLGGSTGFLKCPLTDEIGTPDGKGRFNHFQGGSLYWHPTNPAPGAFVIYGGIKEKWAKLGWEVTTGYPITDELTCPDAMGKYNHFRKYNSAGQAAGDLSIYWHPSNPGDKAFLIYGDIRAKWAKLGWEAKTGYPITDELVCPDGKGRFNHLRRYNNAGQAQGDLSLYWHPSNPGDKAFLIYGDIRAKWAKLGWEATTGYPITDELVCPDGVGRYNHFRKYNSAGQAIGDLSIYWHPTNLGDKAFLIYGAIRDKWASMGWEKSPLGYPITDELPAVDNGRVSYFQKGAIYWNAARGVVVLLNKKQGQPLF